MSRHHPVSPFERASFHRRGSAGWDLSGIQAVAPVAQVNLQPLVAQPISLAQPQSSYSEATRAAGVAQGFFVGPQFALQTADGVPTSRYLMLAEGGRPKLVGWVNVQGQRTPVFQTGRGGDILYVVGEEGETGIRVFQIPLTAPVMPA